MKSKQFTIVNQSDDKATISVDEHDVINIDYGDIPYGFSSEVTLKIHKQGLNVEKTSHKSSCGCTVTDVKVSEGGFIIFKIGYDTKRKGEFSKTALLSIVEKDKQTTELNFKIKGTVK